MRPFIRGNILFVQVSLKWYCSCEPLCQQPGLTLGLRSAGVSHSPWTGSMSEHVRTNDWRHDPLHCQHHVTLSHHVTLWTNVFCLVHSQVPTLYHYWVIYNHHFSLICSNNLLPIYISFKFIATISEDVLWWMRFLCVQKHQLVVWKLYLLTALISEDGYRNIHPWDTANFSFLASTSFLILPLL